MIVRERIAVMVRVREGDKFTYKTKIVEVEVNINTQAIANDMAERLVKSKTGRSAMYKGMVKGKLVQVADSNG